MEIHIKDCNTPLLYIKASKKRPREKIQHDLRITVSNSTFGQLNVSDGYTVNISNCVIDGKVRHHVPLIILKNSSMFVENSRFMNNKEESDSSLITIKNGHSVVIENSEFLNNTLFQKLLDINGTDHVRINVVRLWNNSVNPVNDAVPFLLKLKNVKNLEIYMSRFQQNSIGLSVGAFFLAAVNVNNTIMTSTVFSENIVFESGSLIGIQNSAMEISQCDFSGNRVHNFLLLIDEIRKDKSLTHVEISRSNFTKNIATVTLHIRYFVHVSLDETHFIQNSVLAMTFVEGNTVMNITGSDFLYNFVSGWLFYIRGSSISIKDSRLGNNTSANRGHLISTNSSDAVVESITVENNDGVSFLIAEKSNVSLTNGRFTKNNFDTLIYLKVSEMHLRDSSVVESSLNIIFSSASFINITGTGLSGLQPAGQTSFTLGSRVIIQDCLLMSIGQIVCYNSSCYFEDSTVKNNVNKDSVVWVTQHALASFKRVQFEQNNARILVQVNTQGDVQIDLCTFKNNSAYPDVFEQNSLFMCSESNIIFTSSEIDGLLIPEIDRFPSHTNIITENFAHCDACILSLLNTTYRTHHKQSMFHISSTDGHSDISFYNCTLTFDLSNDHGINNVNARWPSQSTDAQFRYALTRVHVEYPYNQLSVYGMDSHLLKTHNSTFTFDGLEFHSHKSNEPWTVGGKYVNHTETVFASGSYTPIIPNRDR